MRIRARVFCETVGNPAGNVCDLEAHRRMSRTAPACRLIADNTVPTPILLRPIDYGADIVLHSLTKFLGGHGTTLGGIIIDSGNFPWDAARGRFPMLTRARIPPTTAWSIPSTTAPRPTWAGRAASSSAPWARYSRR